MKKSLVFLEIILTLLLIVNVSAGIYFSQPEQVYNLGDTIKLDVSIDPIQEGFLKVDLRCGDKNLNVFNGLPSTGSAKIEFPLTVGYIEDLEGVCYFSANYNGQEKQSSEFKISKTLNLRLDTESLFAKPGESVVVSGIAERLNGIPVEGEVEIKIVGLESVNPVIEETNNSLTNETNNNETETNESENIQNEETSVEFKSEVVYGKINQGKFSVSVNLAKDSPAGNYNVEVLVYEKDSNGRKTSEETKIANLEIAQILKKVDIAMVGQSTDPGVKFDFKPMLLDQSGREIDDELLVVLRDENLNKIFEKIVKSGETIDYDVPGNLTSGYYEVEASKGNISLLKKFYVKEKAIASFVLNNETLTVTNIGNIPYDSDVQVELNGKPIIKKVYLNLGESKEFRLTGNDGQYDIRVSDNENEVSQNGVMLTGNAIGVREVKNGANILTSTPVIWIFFIVILGGVVLFIFKDIFKKKSFAYPFQGRFRKKDSDLVIGASTLRRIDNSKLKPLKKSSETPIQPPRKSVENRSSMQYKPLVDSKKTSEPRKSFGSKTMLENKPFAPKSFEPKKPRPMETRRSLDEPRGATGYRDFRKPRDKIEEMTRIRPGEKTMKLEEVKEEPKSFGTSAPNKAEQVLVLNGQKNAAAVLVLKIKNKLNKVAKDALEEIIELVYEKKGAVYEQGEFIYVIYSPLMTKSFKNEIEATRAGEKIKLRIQDYNRKFKDKIDFGIGINTGEIINKVESKNLKFTALGNLISNAKRLADASNEQVFVTKESYEKSMTEIKAEKKQLGAMQAYEVKSVVDKERNDKFIKSFLSRVNK